MAEPCREQKPVDDGFTLVEVIVALGIFLVVVTALLPQFVGGIRSVSKADREGVVQGVLQQHLDRLRGLPYRVSLGSSGAGTDEDVDLLDIYYPNLVAPTAPLPCGTADQPVLPASTAGTGYVTSASVRCSYEPATVPFYRTVRTTTDAELGPIALVYDLQFLTGGTSTTPAPAVASPRAGYDSNQAVTNYPPSSQVGVTLTLLFRDRGAVVARSLFTQIAKHESGPTLVRTRADVRTVEITSLEPGGAAESLTAGVVSLDASVGDISTAEASMSGVVARVASGDPTTSQLAYGATSTIVAPPSVASLSPLEVTPNWGSAGCQALLCYGSSRISSNGTGIMTDAGLPTAGTPVSPLRASVTDAGAQALTFDNVGAADRTRPWGGPIVRLVGAAGSAVAECPGGAASADRVTGAAYLRTTMHAGSTTVRDTESCAGARAATIGLLPTGLAPDGILQITLTRSFARCTVDNGVPAGATALDAEVRVADGLGGYQPAVSAAGFDPQDHAVLLQPLSSYIQGWTYDAGTVAKPTASSVTATVPGIRVTTVPTRYERGSLSPDPNSAVVVTLGATSCSSESTS